MYQGMREVRNSDGIIGYVSHCIDPALHVSHWQLWLLLRHHIQMQSGIQSKLKAISFCKKLWELFSCQILWSRITMESKALIVCRSTIQTIRKHNIKIQLAFMPKFDDHQQHSLLSDFPVPKEQTLFRRRILHKTYRSRSHGP